MSKVLSLPKRVITTLSFTKSITLPSFQPLGNNNNGKISGSFAAFICDI